MSEVKTIERNYEKIDEIIDILKELYGENEPADFKADVTLTNEQMGVLINALTVRKNVSEAINRMNELATELIAKESPTSEDQMQACFLAYGLNNLELVAMEGDEVDG